MKTYFWTAAIVVFSILWGASAYSQAYQEEISIEALKSKGATVLSADEAEALLTGATLRYGNYGNNRGNIQMRLNADGSLSGSSSKRIVSGSGKRFSGDWKVTSDGRWCGELRSFGHQGGPNFSFCRDILKLGDKYYYSGGNAQDGARPAVEMAVTK